MAKQPRILAGEAAAITGAARGIGRATAAAMLGQGMRVAIGDVDLETARDQPRARNQSPVARVSRACSSGGSSPVAEFAARRS